MSSYDSIYVGFVQTLLSQADIQAEFRNQYASAGLGELSAIDVVPELWVDDIAYIKAVEILQQIKNDRQAAATASWACPQCNESIEAQFSQCWNCGYWSKES